MRYLLVLAQLLIATSCYGQVTVKAHDKVIAGKLVRVEKHVRSSPARTTNKLAFSRSKGISVPETARRGNYSTLPRNTAIVNGRLHSGIYKNSNELYDKIYAEIALNKAIGYNSNLSNVKIGQPLVCRQGRRK